MMAVSSDSARGKADALREHVGAYVAAAIGEPDPFVASCHLALALLFPSSIDVPLEVAAEAKRRGNGMGNPLVDTLVAVAEGIAMFVDGRRDLAARSFHEARRRARHGGPFAEAIAVWTLAVRASAAGFDADPAGSYRDAIERTYERGAWGNLFTVVESLARGWRTQGGSSQLP